MTCKAFYNYKKADNGEELFLPFFAQGDNDMKKSRKKQTPIERAYSKQIKRIKQFIRRAEKRGFQFSDNIIPKKPKRVTEGSVRKLALLTPEKLYKKSVYGGEETGGEIIKGTKGRELERKSIAKKVPKYKQKTPKQEKSNTKGFVPPENISEDTSFFERVTISQWTGTLETFANGEAYTLLKAWMNQTILENGIHDVSVMIQKATENGVLLTWEIVYKSSATKQYIAYMLDYLPESGVLYKDKVMDRIEFMSELDNALEQDEDWELPT